jgi:4-carboxymuconolactone decarboxylase
MGDYLRYHSAIGNTLSEFVILVTARECSQDYEWHVHRQDGQKLVRFPDQAVAQKQHGRTVGVPA